MYLYKKLKICIKTYTITLYVLQEGEMRMLTLFLVLVHEKLQTEKLPTRSTNQSNSKIVTPLHVRVYAYRVMFFLHIFTTQFDWQLFTKSTPM